MIRLFSFLNEKIIDYRYS